MTLLLLFVPVAAAAHTDLVSTFPEADGQVVVGDVDEVLITFADPLAPDGDHAIGVFGPDGDTRVDRDDTTLATPAQIRVTVDIARPGRHTVQWVVVAEDGDEQRGDFTFDVQPESAPTAPPATATETPADDPTSAQPALLPTADATDNDNGGGVPVVPVAVVAALVIGAGLVVRSRRSPD